MDELKSKRDLIPSEGYSRLQSEARAEAIARRDSGNAQSARSLAALEAALQDAALPDVNYSKGGT